MDFSEPFISVEAKAVGLESFLSMTIWFLRNRCNGSMFFEFLLCFSRGQGQRVRPVTVGK